MTKKPAYILVPVIMLMGMTALFYILQAQTFAWQLAGQQHLLMSYQADTLQDRASVYFLSHPNSQFSDELGQVSQNKTTLTITLKNGTVVKRTVKTK